jgi:hypothetical protein
VVLAPFWVGAPADKFRHEHAKYEGGRGRLFKVSDTGGTTTLECRVSRDMHRGERSSSPTAWCSAGSGEETQQGWPDMGLQFHSWSVRRNPAMRSHVLDAMTEAVDERRRHLVHHFSGITVANGRVYLGSRRHDVFRPE